MLNSTHCTLRKTTLKTIVSTNLFTVICIDLNLNLIWEYVIVTDELSNKAEFINLRPIADGISALAIIPLILTAGAHMLLVNHENNKEKKAKASAATSQ